MIKLEMHAHTAGGSPCAKESPKTLAEVYKAHGYGGVVLTNHYCKACYDEYPGETHAQKLDFYFGLYENFADEMHAVGMKPFYGAEVRAFDPEGYFTEYLIYGFERQLLYGNPPLFMLTQHELFDLCNKYGVFMAQSHPFRYGVKTGFPEYMHGAEAFNGHIFHQNHNDVADVFTREFNLKRISGTDFHETKQMPCGGIYLPDNIDDSIALGKYLLSCQPTIINPNEQVTKRNLANEC